MDTLNEAEEAKRILTAYWDRHRITARYWLSVGTVTPVEVGDGYSVRVGLEHHAKFPERAERVGNIALKLGVYDLISELQVGQDSVAVAQ
jgi:hypothetical protein